MVIWKGIGKVIDSIAELMGRIGWLLVMYCMLFGVADVFFRYVLNSASQWIGASIQAAMVLIACMGGAYALKHNAFIKLDLFYANFSKRKKAACDIATSIFTFCFLGALIWKGIDAARLSIMLNQMTTTAIPIPIYPIKTIIPISAFVVLLVVIKQFFCDVKTLLGREKQIRESRA
ncbi:TRAP transporter small permease subunit [Modicisalibacter muralis]|uniref:TRAP transporter small permease subunit n=1 Tax=Modicisalibacter muralis TaxID=119000 RepID=UPI000B7EA976|nr:TRAP transporter small permease subunit [Halomonas muralis]